MRKRKYLWGYNMSIKILHLSDIHIGQCVYDNNVETLALRISNEIAENYNSGLKFNTIVVSGDIFDGNVIAKTSERNKRINDAIAFFDVLLSNLSMDGFKIDKENVIFCPGNHDVIRTEKEADFSVYIEFLIKFYGEDLFNSKFELFNSYKSSDSLISLNLYKDDKIGILSLNSACISKDTNVQNQIEKLIENMNISSFESAKDNPSLDINKLKIEIESYIREKSQSKYLDYGYISDIQLANIRRMLNNVENIESYTLIAVFHHHLQPFPEVMLKDKSDISIMKNSSEVINRLLKHKINVVLHGHKHMDLITPIANEQFIENQEDMIFAISAGSIGKKDITNRMFQIVEVFARNESRTKLKITKYKYNQDKCEIDETIEIPPKEKNGVNSNGILMETLKDLDLKIYNNYIDKLYESDVTSSLIIKKYIKFIENTIFNFSDVCNRLNKDKHISLLILITIHYRINSYLDNDGNYTKRIRDFFQKYTGKFNFDENYFNDLINFIETDFINNGNVYKILVRDENIKYKNYTAFVLATTLIVDIYMFLSTKTERYFKYIKHKLNITVDISNFNSFIPPENIIISSIPDRREVNIELKSKHPSFHKVAVLILKNIEKNINRYEKQLGEIGLKLYHIKTKIDKQGYEQNDYNFEAYLPTLMKLLIGKNLYKQKEVFVRELIQNSFDAIMLRKKIDSKCTINETIKIEMRVESEIEKLSKQHEVKSKILTIKDEGIGMNLHNIERYFTGIGRSFYTSDDFAQLKKVTDTKYSAISNFGIGFLSCFMVAEEIDVNTRYYEKGSSMISVNIPNFDGCFFVRNQGEFGEIGTTITLYEKSTSVDKLMDFEDIYNYIKESFIDFPLGINIKIDNSRTVNIEPFSKRMEITKIIEEGKNIVLHVFIDEDGNISYNNENNLFEKNYGIFIIFQDMYSPSTPSTQGSIFRILNSGIALQINNHSRATELLDPGLCKEFIINYPPSLIQLDVSRESIVGYKYIDKDKQLTIRDKKEDIRQAMLEQIKKIFRNCLLTKYSISQYFHILSFVNRNISNKNEIDDLINQLPEVYITWSGNRIVLSNQEISNQAKFSMKIKTLMDVYRNYIYNTVNYYMEKGNNINYISRKLEADLNTLRRYHDIQIYNTDIEHIHRNKDSYNYNELLMHVSEWLLFNTYDISETNLNNNNELSFIVNQELSKLNIKNNKSVLLLMNILLKIFMFSSYTDVSNIINIDIHDDNRMIFEQLLFEHFTYQEEFLTEYEKSIK